jgi:hypothetical protein
MCQSHLIASLAFTHGHCSPVQHHTRRQAAAIAAEVVPAEVQRAQALQVRQAAGAQHSTARQSMGQHRQTHEFQSSSKAQGLDFGSKMMLYDVLA